MSYNRAGFSNILIINAHRGNVSFIKEALSELNNNGIRYIFYKDLLSDKLDETYRGKHSNRLETELALLANKDSVNISKAKDCIIEDENLIKDKFDRKLMPECIDGFPTKANVNDAKSILEILITKMKKIANGVQQ